MYGIMFHHFYDDRHPKVQGAISSQDFEDILNYIGLENILSAEEFVYQIKKGTGNKNKCCLTFDDNLKCQFDIAYPVLKKYNLSAFWFIYTSPFEGRIEKIELYRYYRTVFFKQIDQFYDFFFNYLYQLDIKHLIDEKLKEFSADHYLKGYDFYTYNDKKFRFLRNEVLKDKYFKIMDDIIKKNKEFDPKDVKNKLWMCEENIKMLSDEGHEIGLHSHTHPIGLGKKSYEIQKQEYKKNQQIIFDLINRPPISVSYPGDSYNFDTIKIMKELNIEIGFIANFNCKQKDILHIKRQDHINIFKEVKKCK